MEVERSPPYPSHEKEDRHSPRRSPARDRSRTRYRSPPRRSPPRRSPPRRSPPRRRYSRSRSRSPRRRVDSRERRPRMRSPPRRYSSNSSGYRKEHAPADPCKVLGVFGLSIDTKERDLEDIYSKFGKIHKTQIVYDRQTQRSRGFGFVYFDSVQEAERAMEHTNGMSLNGRNIRVDFSKTERPHSPTPGRYLGPKREDSPERRDRFDRRDRRENSPGNRRRRSRGRSYSRSRSR